MLKGMKKYEYKEQGKTLIQEAPPSMNSFSSSLYQKKRYLIKRIIFMRTQKTHVQPWPGFSGLTHRRPVFAGFQVSDNIVVSPRPGNLPVTSVLTETRNEYRILHF